MDGDDDKVRCSSLSSYPDCPRRGAARLFWREIAAAGYTLRQTPRGVGAAIGTGVHEGAAHTLREKLFRGALAPLDAVTDCAVETYRMEVAGGVMYDQASPSSNTAEQQIVRMTTAYQKTIAPLITPLTVEAQLEADTGFGIVLTGRSDVLACEPGIIRDLKTGKRHGVHTCQMGGYSLLNKANGLDVQEAGIDFVPRVPITKPQPESISTKYSIEICETAALNVLRHIASDLKTFREGDTATGIQPGDSWAFIANPNSNLCHANWCSAYGTDFCHEWEHKDA